MKTYVQPGNTIIQTAPYAVASGDDLLVGSVFGVASGTTALGETVETALVGVYELKKLGSLLAKGRATGFPSSEDHSSGVSTRGKHDSVPRKAPFGCPVCERPKYLPRRFRLF